MLHGEYRLVRLLEQKKLIDHNKLFTESNFRLAIDSYNMNLIQYFIFFMDKTHLSKYILEYLEYPLYMRMHYVNYINPHIFEYLISCV